jgi:hypothetical protein
MISINSYTRGFATHVDFIDLSFGGEILVYLGWQIYLYITFILRTNPFTVIRINYLRFFRRYFCASYLIYKLP